VRRLPTVTDQNECVYWKVSAQDVPDGRVIVEAGSHHVVPVPWEFNSAVLGAADVEDSIEERNVVDRGVVRSMRGSIGSGIAMVQVLARGQRDASR
jgi:hypothetical protein